MTNNNYITYLRRPSKTPSINIPVFCRFRPLTDEELLKEKEKSKKKSLGTIELNPPNQIILNKDNDNDLIEYYNFDALFEEKSSQEEIYNISSKGIINKILSGYNGAIICFGQTGMGKTYTKI